MKKRILIFSMTVASALFIANCSSDDDGGGGTPEPVKNKMELISENTWLVKSIIVDGLDLFTVYDECAKDNEYNFGKDYKLVISDGALKCNPSLAGTSAWGFVSDSTRLRIERDTMDIMNLTAKELQVKRKEGTKDQIVTYMPKE